MTIADGDSENAACRQGHPRRRGYRNEYKIVS